MMEKINRIGLRIIGYGLLIGLLIYSRLLNISWGLPYPMHPDERNMAVAVQTLTCQITNNQLTIANLKQCFNPHFFAYGQLPLYLGYLLIWIYHGLKEFGRLLIPLPMAIISLRLISALASVINVFILIKIINELLISLKINAKNNRWYSLMLWLPLIFVPFFIQFAHFGTTESLLMLFSSLGVYWCLLFANKKLSIKRFIYFSALTIGSALATKISAILLICLPVILLVDQGLIKIKPKDSVKKRIKIFVLVMCQIGLLAIGSLIISVIFSPHNWLSWKEFIGAINYEQSVALGTYRAFYTRQFVDSQPILFQARSIFPYVLGGPLWMLFIFGFIFLPWNNNLNILRLAILIQFFPNSLLYAKWTRFMAPIFPLMLVIADLFLIYIQKTIINMKERLSNKFKQSITRFKIQRIIITIYQSAFVILILAAILPGIAYLAVYQEPDVRFKASDWIYRNVPEQSYILSETANVVDIPIAPPNYQLPISDYKIISFNFYDLDINPLLQQELQQHLAVADYIFIPSRRILMNHTCYKSQISNLKSQIYISNFKSLTCNNLVKDYPQLNRYYSQLFSEELGFKPVAEFSSYPTLQLSFNQMKLTVEFPDEQAEETWTVFDHPVIRIYQRDQSL